MSKEYFVNRRGKKSDIDGVVHDIEKTEVVKPLDPPQKLQKPNTPPRKLRFPAALRNRSSRILTGIIIVVVGVAAVLLILADTARRDYQRQAARMQNTVQEVARQTISTQTSAKDAAEGLLKKLKNNHSCHTNVPPLIAKNYKPAQKTYDECQSMLNSYTSVTNSLARLIKTSRYLEEQKKLLAPALSAPTDGAFAEVPSYASTWKTASESLAQANVPSECLSAHTALRQTVDLVAKAWSKLSVASAAQNAEAFTATETDLAKAYERLRTSGDEFDSIVLAQQKELDQAVSKF